MSKTNIIETVTDLPDKDSDSTSVLTHRESPAKRGATLGDRPRLYNPKKDRTDIWIWVSEETERLDAFKAWYTRMQGDNHYTANQWLKMYVEWRLSSL